jgi:hypothetical protein
MHLYENAGFGRCTKWIMEALMHHTKPWFLPAAAPGIVDRLLRGYCNCFPTTALESKSFEFYFYEQEAYHLMGFARCLVGVVRVVDGGQLLGYLARELKASNPPKSYYVFSVLKWHAESVASLSLKSVSPIIEVRFDPSPIPRQKKPFFTNVYFLFSS